MMVKKRLLALCLGLAVACSSIAMPGQADIAQAQTEAKQVQESLTPKDLHFRKFYTGRNLFDSEIPVAELDLQEAAGDEGISCEQGKLRLTNTGNSTVYRSLELGGMTPYSVYDLAVTGQEAADEYAAAEIRWKKDADNSVCVRKYTVAQKEEDNGQNPEEEEGTVLAELDMSDDDLLKKVAVYDDLSPYNTASKVEGGIRFEAKGNKGETYIPVGSLQQNTVLEAEVSEQNKSGYTASAILKFRDKTADNSRATGIFLTQRANGSFTLEVLVGGASKKNVNIAGGTACPYKLRLALQGKKVVASRVVNGQEEGIEELDVSQWFDFSNADTLKNFEATIGSKLGTGESMTYTSAEIKKYKNSSEEELPEDKGYVLTVKKDGRVVVNKTIAYPKNLTGEEPYTMRTHWAGQYLCFWLVKDGKPYLMGTEDLGRYFDMRSPSVRGEFRTCMGAELTAGAELEISEFRNYYSGGDGQADPKPLMNKDGSVIVEDGKMWISMTLRGYQPLPASCQGIYSFDLKTYELKLVNITTFRKTDKETDGDTEWAYHASAFVYDKDEDVWHVVTSSHGDDKMLRAGTLPTDPRKTDYVVVPVKKINYAKIGEDGKPVGVDGKSRNDYEDPSIIYHEELGKWVIAACASGYGGYGVALLQADTFDGSYEETAIYDIGSCTGILQQKVGGKYYVFTGRSPGGDNGTAGKMRLEAINYEPVHDKGYPQLTRHCELNIDGQTDSANPWPMLYPTVNEKGETVYRLLTFDRDTMIGNDGSHTMMASGQYTYGRIYLYEALEKDNSKDTMPEKPEVSAENVEVITTADQLWAISEDLEGTYELGADIDLGNREWYPIGTKEQPFTGIFDGKGHTISGLTATETKGMTGVGLFGYAEGASISNVKITGANVKGRIYTGALAGYNDKGTIFKCTVSGTVTGESETGLLVGRNTGAIEGCSATGTVTGIGNDSTGGLAGSNATGTVEQCSAEATVTGTVNVGGLVGYNDKGFIRNTYAKGKVEGINYAGGLVGASSSYGLRKDDISYEACYVEDSYAVSEVKGNTAGTLVGFNDKNITNCFAQGAVTGLADGFVVGGLIGRNNQYGIVKNSYAESTVSGNTYVGGLFGKNTGSFSNVACSAAGVAIGNSRDTMISGEVPVFTDSETYKNILGWNEEAWIISEGKLPVLNPEYRSPEPPGPEVGEELLSNTGFEPDLANWASYEGATLGQGFSTKHSGTHSLKVTNRTKTGSGAVQDITGKLRAGETYALDGYICYRGGTDNVNPPETAEFCLTLLYGKKEKRQVMVSQEIKEGGEWGQISGTYTVPEDADLRKVSFLIETAYKDEPTSDDLIVFFADDVSMKRTESEEDLEEIKKLVSRAEELVEDAKASAETAAQAEKNAQAAKDSAEAAKGQAETAKGEAQAAEAAAKTAQTKAEEAQKEAEAARKAAEDMAADASAGAEAVETAKATAETARDAAETAKKDAENAKAAALMAQTAAEDARKKAEEAEDRAAAAGETAQTAAKNAQTAQANAQTAMEKAREAQEAAEDAAADAAGARDAAEVARRAVEEAKDSIMQAREDAEAAREESEAAKADAQKARKAAEDAAETAGAATETVKAAVESAAQQAKLAEAARDLAKDYAEDARAWAEKAEAAYKKMQEMQKANEERHRACEEKLAELERRLKESEKKADPDRNGEEFSDGKLKYAIRDASGRTVEVLGACKNSVKKVTIPDTVKSGGITYQVTAIKRGAFRYSRNLRSVVLGRNVKSVGQKAFYGCKKLKGITIKTKKLTKQRVGSQAFKGIYSKAVITVPEAKSGAYRKLLRAKGLSKKVKFKKY